MRAALDAFILVLFLAGFVGWLMIWEAATGIPWPM